MNLDEYTLDDDDKIDLPPGVMVHGGKRYAVGLVWLMADEHAGPSLSQKRATSLEADYYCVRSTIVEQHGFGYMRDGHRTGMSVAATAAADTLAGEWHGVFKASNGWWYVAQHGDAIAPDGDKFFTSEEKAYAWFNERNEGYKWPRTYAPESWNIPDASDVSLDKIFDTGTLASLRPANMDALFSGKRNKRIAGALGIGVLLIVAMVMLLPRLMPELQNKPTRPPFSTFAEMPKVIKIPPPEVVTITDENTQTTTPSVVIIPAGDIVNACMQEMANIVHPIPGWSLQSLNCNTGSIHAGWRRTTGSLASLRETASFFPERAKGTYDGKDFFKISYRMPSFGNHTKIRDFIKKDDAILALNDRFSTLGELNVEYVVPQRKKERNQSGGFLVKKDVQKSPGRPFLIMTLTTRMQPPALVYRFNMTGFALQNIAWVVPNKTWIYRARIEIGTGGIGYGKF